MIGQIRARKRNKCQRAQGSYQWFAPGPRISIPASGYIRPHLKAWYMTAPDHVVEPLKIFLREWGHPYMPFEPRL